MKVHIPHTFNVRKLNFVKDIRFLILMQFNNVLFLIKIISKMMRRL